MSEKLSLFEKDVIQDHFHLDHDDRCYYFLEYTSGRDWKFGVVNSFISNLKKPMRERERPNVWQHKEDAIQMCSEAFERAMDQNWLSSATLIPVPPSKAKSDQDYDDRILRILNGISLPFKVDVRELVIQNTTLKASHISEQNRISLEELIEAYVIEESIAEPVPTTIGVVDDILVAGTHFKAMKIVLNKRYPGVPVYGFFVARRVFPSDSDPIDET